MTFTVHKAIAPNKSRVLPLLFVFFALWTFLSPVVMSAPIIDPAGTGFGSMNYSMNIVNLTENWRRYQNVSFTVNVNGKTLEVVPWMSRGDQCLLAQGANGLHACSNTNPPFDNANLSNQTFCMVTDELSQVMLSDALSLGGTNATRLDNWVNTIEAYQTCGQAGNLTEWTVGIRYVGSGNWEFNCSQVADSATDGDAHIIVALAAINNSAIANSSTRQRAGDLLGAMCYGLASQNFLPYNITNRINRGENISFLPCGGDDVCTDPSNSAFAYTAYNGPILEALGACQAYYGADTAAYNWTKLADSTVQAHLQASNWTGDTFTVGYGRSYHWANYTSAGTAYAVCDNSCTPAPFTDDPDGMRAPRICNGAYVWEAYRNVTLRNITTYCQQWMNLVGETNTTHVIERYFNGTAKSSTSDSGYKAVGLGAFMNTLVNTTFGDDRIATYYSHLSWSGVRGTMDSQACFGVYDKAFGIMALEYLVGYAAPAMTASAGAGGNGTPASTVGGLNITLNSPLNNSWFNVSFVVLNVTVWNNNNTNATSSTPGTLPHLIYNSNICSADPGFTGATYSASTCSENWTSGNLYSNNLGMETSYPTGEFELLINLSYPGGTNNKFRPTNIGVSGLGTGTNKFNMEAQNATHWHLKADRGGYSQTTNVYYNQSVILNFTTNFTNNVSRACIGTSCTNWEAFARDAGAEDYFAIEAGNPSGLATTIYNYTLYERVTAYNNTVSTAGNSTMNVTFYYQNGTVIYAATGVTNATSVSFNLTGITNGTYTWLVNAISKDNNVTLTPLLFEINTSEPYVPPAPTPASSNSVCDNVLGGLLNLTGILVTGGIIIGFMIVLGAFLLIKEAMDLNQFLAMIGVTCFFVIVSVLLAIVVAPLC